MLILTRCKANKFEISYEYLQKFPTKDYEFMKSKCLSVGWSLYLCLCVGLQVIHMKSYEQKKPKKGTLEFNKNHICCCLKMETK